MASIGNAVIAKLKLCVKHLVTKSITVADGETCFHSNTMIQAGSSVTINGTGEFIIIGTGG